MRESLALRAFAPIVVCSTIALLLSPPAATQTQPSAADPRASHGTLQPLTVTAASEALLKTLRQPDIAFYVSGAAENELSRAFRLRQLRSRFPSARLVTSPKDANVVLAIATGPREQIMRSRGASIEYRHERAGTFGWFTTEVCVRESAAPPAPRPLIIAAFVAGSPEEAVVIFRGPEMPRSLDVALSRLAAMK